MQNYFGCLSGRTENFRRECNAGATESATDPGKLRGHKHLENYETSNSRRAARVLLLFPDMEKTAHDLTVNHLSNVHALACQTRALSAVADTDELMSDGFFGLLQAAARYKVKGTVLFSTYAYTRIRGAMLDSSRKEYAFLRLKQGLRNKWEASPVKTPLELLMLREKKRILLEAIKRLSKQERRIVTDYYYGGHTLTSVACSLGMSISRASHIHREALQFLSCELQKAFGTNTAVPS